MEQDFSARPGVAVVTGATGGIGSAVARMLVARGCAVVLAYRSDADAAAALAAELNATDPAATGTTRTDTTRTGAVQPGTTRTDAGQPGGVQPGTTRTDAGQPGTTRTDAAQPGAVQPGATRTDANTADERVHETGATRKRRATAVRADLTDPAACAALIGAAGEVHTLVHAAGPHVPMMHLSTIAPERFAEQVAQDVLATFNIVRAALPALRASRGSIVAVTTAATRRFPVRDGLSAVPKGAVESLMRGIAAEEGRFGVRANCVGPGMLTDGMAARLIADGDLHEHALAVTRSNIPLRTFGTAADIAEAVCFLASDRARFISGQKLDVDGGYAA
ncbi:SDR family NAD(P)-dependent oxidoreductase [Dactylosporangium sp. CA-052675]|uniref:SDR family NAD(P)-dependent oxidoreductase n=1 Tax=Dactylosporangium sp. CA-052675 TaxID=3239927 RepID=UPI003D8C1ABC